LLAQNKKVNVRQLDKGGISRAKRKGLLEKANNKVDNLDAASDRALKGVSRNASEHLNSLDKARNLLSARGRAPSFTPRKGEAFRAAAAKGDKSGIAPIGESPPITRNMVEGDVSHLQSAMKDSGFTPSQSYIHYQKVNQYVQDMLNGTFNWRDPSLGQKGKVIEIGPGNTIQHGHHRVVAAEIVSQLTGRPVFGGPNPIIPNNRWAKVPKNTNLPGSRKWTGVGVDMLPPGSTPKPVPSPRGPTP